MASASSQHESREAPVTMAAGAVYAHGQQQPERQPARPSSTSQLPPRNRKGILTRQASEHERDDADLSARALVGQSEDDEASRGADSSIIPDKSVTPLTEKATATLPGGKSYGPLQQQQQQARSLSSASGSSGGIASGSSSPASGQSSPLPSTASAVKPNRGTNGNNVGIGGGGISAALQRDASKRNAGPGPSPLSPAGSQLGSTGSQSASSSRSFLPLQSKTSLYRRQASGAGSGGDVSEDGGQSIGGASLDRAKSVSSVSSVTSTSSMEAVPFRAAPLGNVRTGFGGFIRGNVAAASRMAPTSSSSSHARPGWGGEAVDLDDPQGSANWPSVDSEGGPGVPSLQQYQQQQRNATESSGAAGSARARLLPKGPSDEWHYRNAPGLGLSRGGPRSSVPAGDFTTILDTRSLGSNVEQLRRVHGITIEDQPQEQGMGKRKAGIRSKLAKRAGKMGLKPLTNVHVQPQSTSASSSSQSLTLVPPMSSTAASGPSSILARSTSPKPLLDVDNGKVTASSPFVRPSTPGSSSAAMRSSGGAGPSPSMISGPSLPLLAHASRLSPETTFKAAKSYFGESDSMAMMRTSSVTNAPLIVPKHIPGPPGTGPPPSPGIMGAPSSPNNINVRGNSNSSSNMMYGFPVAGSHSPKVSPTSEEEKMVGTSSSSVRNSAEMRAHSPPMPPVRPQARRPNSFGSLTNLFGAVRINQSSSSAQHTPIRSPSPLATSTNGATTTFGQDSREGTLSPFPLITPAQQVRLEAEAGLARPPAEPSGPNPGSSPTPAAVHESSIDDAFLVPGRPHSTSISSTLVTAKPRSSVNAGHRYSSSAGSQTIAAASLSRGSSKRPGLLRAVTSDSLMSKRKSQGSSGPGDEERDLWMQQQQQMSSSPLRSNSKDLQVDQNTGVSAYWSGRPMRSGSTSSSPMSPSSPASAQLRLDIPMARPLLTGSSGEATPLFALSPGERTPSIDERKRTRAMSPERPPTSNGKEATSGFSQPRKAKTSPTMNAAAVPDDDVRKTEMSSPKEKAEDIQTSVAAESTPSVVVWNSEAGSIDQGTTGQPRSNLSAAADETIHEEVSEEERQQQNGSIDAINASAEKGEVKPKRPSLAVTRVKDSDASLPSQAISLASDPDASIRTPVKQPFVVPSLATSTVAATDPEAPASSRLSTIPGVSAPTAPGPTKAAEEPKAKPTRSTRVRSDFEFGDILGEGSYSTVIQAWDLLSIDQKATTAASASVTASSHGTNGQRNTALEAIVGKTSKADVRRAQRLGAKVYAIKVLDKVHILKEKKQKYVNVEKEALSLLIRHPGVITLFWTFQDHDSLYFVLELAPNGELLSFIKKLGSFDLTGSRYYAAQLLDTIEGIHAVGVIHRDIKPENVLLDSEMRVKVTDFGSAKIKKRVQPTSSSATGDEQERASSFVGTAEYVSPELLTDKSVTELSDLWAFGCVLYQMICGRPPFKGVSEYQTFQKIIKGDYDFPDGFPEEGRSLVAGLLNLDAEKRFRVEDIKAHEFFAGVQWKEIWKERAPELKAGMYKRPEPVRPVSAAQSSNFEGIAWGGGEGEEAEGRRAAEEEDDDNDEDDDDDDEEDDDDNDEDDEADADEKEGDAVASESLSSRVSRSSNDSEVIARRQAQDDADDDDSSISDSGPVPRRRGFSTGSAVAERMLGVKRSNNIMRLATGGGNGSSNNNNSSSGNTNNRASRGPIHRSSFGSAAIGSISSKLSGQAQASSSQQPSAGRDSTSSSSGHHVPGNEGTVRASKSSRPPLFSSSTVSPDDRSYLSSAADTSWAALLLPHEALLYAAPILHRQTGAFRTSSKRRQLLLTDFPRLLCVKETNDQLKVKSEVILAIPAFLSARLPLAAASESMRRQSSAGPSFALVTNESSPSASQQQRRRDNQSPRRIGQEGDFVSSGGAQDESTSTTGRLLRRDSLPLGISSRRRGSSSKPVETAGGMTSSSSNAPAPASGASSSASIGAMPPMAASDLLPNFLNGLDQKGARTFIVQTPARSYIYEDPSGDANQWIRSITNAVRRAQAT